MFDATFNTNAFSWRSDLLAEDAGVPGDNHIPSVGKLTFLANSDSKG